MITKTRRRCTEVFKEEAVCLVRDSRHPVSLMAQDLGIADHLLYCWHVEQQQVDGHGPTRQSRRVEHAELARLEGTSHIGDLWTTNVGLDIPYMALILGSLC